MRPTRLSPLDWASSHFGLKMAQLSCDNLTEHTLAMAMAEAAGHGFDLTEACCDISDESSIRLLEQNGFRCVGGNLTLEKTIGGMGNALLPTLRKSEPVEIPALLDTFSGIFQDSRYYKYPRLSSEKVSELYQVWLKNGVLGTFDDECLLLEELGDILAFVCMSYDSHDARIGLLGVNPSHRKCGHGITLLNALENRLLRAGFRAIKVKTQLENIAAIRLYEKAGYRTSAVELYFVHNHAH